MFLDVSMLNEPLSIQRIFKAYIYIFFLPAQTYVVSCKEILMLSSLQLIIVLF